MTKNIVLVLGIVFILIGLLGLVNNPVIGLFPVNMPHNLVHLLSGVLAVIFALQGERAAKNYSKVFGIIYGLVAILGFILPDLMANLLAIDSADNILHVILAVVFLYLGFSAGKMMTAAPKA